MTTFNALAAHPALAELTMQQLHQSNVTLRAFVASFIPKEPMPPEEVRAKLGPTDSEHSSEAI